MPRLWQTFLEVHLQNWGCIVYLGLYLVVIGRVGLYGSVCMVVYGDSRLMVWLEVGRYEVAVE